jgi:predicted methyltransferase
MFRRNCKAFALLACALLAVSLASAAPAAASASDDTIALLQKAVNGDWRSAAQEARDPYRRPIEILQFFGTEPNMTVIELEPGEGSKVPYCKVPYLDLRFPLRLLPG